MHCCWQLAFLGRGMICLLFLPFFHFRTRLFFEIHLIRQTNKNIKQTVALQWNICPMWMHKRMVEIINSSKVPPVLRWKMCNSFSSYLEDSPPFFFLKNPCACSLVCRVQGSKLRPIQSQKRLPFSALRLKKFMFVAKSRRAHLVNEKHFLVIDSLVTICD